MKISTDDIIRLFREEPMVVFCGAGISMLEPSRSPSWWDIYLAATSALRDRFEEGFPEYNQKIPLTEILQPFSTQQLADTIITELAGETFVQILKVVDVADPNENHVLLSALAEKGYLKGILTTNWDTILERTAALKGFQYHIVIPGPLENVALSNATPLIKMHGSAIDPANLKETFSHKAREISDVLRLSWIPLLKGTNLLVMGFSGADLDFGAVHTFIEDFLKDGKHIWWLHRPGAAPVLPENISSRVTLIEGSLPFFLRDLSVKLDVKGFSTPVSGRNAQHELVTAMRDWSKEDHIGKWAAAKFFFSMLGKKGLKNRNGEPLYNFLMQLAESNAIKINDAVNTQTNISFLEFLLIGLFLSGAGMQALKDTQHEKQK